MSGRFSKTDELKERAHGDGLMIGYDSPEAFEEVIWKAFWPDKYHKSNIDIWSSDDEKEAANDFFIKHFQKIVKIRNDGQGRYISKNNNNISRVSVLKEMFPGAEIVIPLRNPAEHIASLVRQHNNFLQQHSHSPFVKKYMADIGHYEFGELHKPFSFPNFDYSRTDTDTYSYWLDYWISAYQYVYEHRDKLLFITQEAVCDKPNEVMWNLCEKLSLDSQGMDFKHIFKQIKNSAGDEITSLPKYSEAVDLYQAFSDLN
jgi:hypothetical protein